MAAPARVKALGKLLDRLRGSRDPETRLDLARRIREAAEDLEREAVRAARDAGLTWSDIGTCYGTTKQAVQQRFRG